eukprot:CAMPEP_0170621542 /NCGR_PEP_ID=MMETSP0224-20130122/28653_1 /TAXON_ID=285029 /ORGANISM="Togula jolla, Strain CCCM 725" /LENGTH=151 /DNA_ID=CAMNT_0010947801 /DNA_START=95 /DNA_END=550 /DNA_ORIENTATION=-
MHALRKESRPRPRWTLVLASASGPTFHNTFGTLAAETVDGAPLALESVDDVQSGHSLAACVLRVRDGVTQHVLQERLQNTTGLLVDEPADTLHAATTCQSANGWFCDTLDVVSEHLPVPHSAALAHGNFLALLAVFVALGALRCGDGGGKP